jgi:alanine dehydrogenase
MLVLSGRDIAGLVDAADLIAPLETAMRAVSRGEAELPLRSMVPIPGSRAMGIMGGWLGQPAGHGIKVLSLFPENPKHGRSSHAGLMLLFDAETGLAKLCMDAAELTALRTAAASALATRVLARADARGLAILGTGEEAGAHVRAMRAVRPIEDLVVWGRDAGKSAAFAERHGGRVAGSVAEAVASADIVVTATSARTPFLAADMLRPGQHVNAVGGSVAAMQELEPGVLARVSLFTDYIPSMEPQAAEVIAARREGIIGPDHQVTEIGAVLNGAPGRRDAAEITLYRSLGIAAQDLAAAHFILERAVAAGLGVEVDMA